MKPDNLEEVGAIRMPQENNYVVHLENLPAVISRSLENRSKVSVIGKTSSNDGAALIVSVSPLEEEAATAATAFYAAAESRTGLSQALMDVIGRRS